MKSIYTKAQIEDLEERFEILFPLPYRPDKIPDQLIEIIDVSYDETREEVINRNFSLIICLPRLPVIKALKNAEIIDENNLFRLVRVSPKHYNLDIEEFLKESEFNVSFLWAKEFKSLKFGLSQTGHKKILIENLDKNEIYTIGIETRDCIKASWG